MTPGGMSDLTIPTVDPPPVTRDTSGEMRIPDRWTNCVICGARTSQPPVCHDLRCEMEVQS